MLPTPIYKNEIIEISRRTEGRQFFMRPDPAMRLLSLYLIAYYAKRHGLSLICFCVMSNHYHVIAQDPKGRRAMFTRDLNRSLSAYTNRIRWRTGRAFWDGRGPAYIRIRDAETLLERIAYVCSNPAHHGAVDVSSCWPGALLGPDYWGKTIAVHRPKLLDVATTLFPPTVVFSVNSPPAVGEERLADWTSRCLDAIRRREDEARTERTHTPAGAAAAARAPITTMVFDPDLRDVAEHLPPRKAAPLAFGSKELRETVREQVQDFRSDYIDARHAWLHGDPGTCFPTGTQTLMSRYSCLAVATPDPWAYPFPYE